MKNDCSNPTNTPEADFQLSNCISNKTTLTLTAERNAGTFHPNSIQQLLPEIVLISTVNNILAIQEMMLNNLNIVEIWLEEYAGVS